MSHRLYNYFISFHFSGAFAQLRLRGKIFEKEVRGIYCTWGAVPKCRTKTTTTTTTPPPSPFRANASAVLFLNYNHQRNNEEEGEKKRNNDDNKTSSSSSFLHPYSYTAHFENTVLSQITGHRHSSFSARPGPRPTFQHLGDSIASLFPRKLGVKRQRVCTLP